MMITTEEQRENEKETSVIYLFILIVSDGHEEIAIRMKEEWVGGVVVCPEDFYGNKQEMEKKENC